MKGTVNAGNSTISFTGTGSNAITSGGASLYNVEVNKSSGADLNLTDNMVVTNQLSFSGNNNKVNLANSDLTLGSGATISGADDQDFLVTGGTGEVIKESLATFTFPVGFSGSTYNPITIVESGTTDNIGVQVLENAYDDGTSGGAQLTSEVVNATWVVSENTPGGSDLNVTVDWAASDEQGDFDRTKSGIARYDGTSYDLTLANVAAATGSDPYTRNRSSVEPGPLVVGGGAVMDKVLVAPTVLLSGPYNGSDMNDDLRAEGVLPIAEPYTGLGYTHVGLGGGESVANAGLFDQAGTNADIVDWIFLELRDKNNNQTVLGTQSALLQRDGNIVGTDFMPVEFKGFSADSYFLTIRHRNHLAIQSLNTVALDKISAASVDFTDNSTATFGTDAQRTDGSLYYLWSGKWKWKYQCDLLRCRFRHNADYFYCFLRSIKYLIRIFISSSWLSCFGL